MKELVRKLSTLILFEFPLRHEYISAQFTSKHNNYLQQFPHWSLAATRKKVISDYWFRQVLYNFACIIAIALVCTIPFTGSWHFAAFPLFLALIISFVILTCTNYWPMFYSDFLPKLDTVITTFKDGEKEQRNEEWKHQYEQLTQLRKQLAEKWRQQQEQLKRKEKHLQEQKMQLEIRQSELEKTYEEEVHCRKSQLSNFSVVLVFYALDKVEGLNFLQCNNKSAALLTKLFGKDQADLLKKLQLIYGKKKKLNPKALTILHNQFVEAYTILEELKFSKAIRVLMELEKRFNQ